MGQYGYNPGNAATFNQLVRTGLTVEEASTQSGVSTNAGQYGFGPNSNAGSVIPGAGGTTNAAGLTTVSYAQSSTGEPAQQPPQTSTPTAGVSTFQDPAQRAGQNALTSPQPGPSPFAAFNRVETVPITAPAPSTFQDPAQRAAAAAAVPPVQAAEPAPSPITETPSDSRIISSTPNASSGFGYGTGINNPSVAPTTAADTVNANTSGIPIRNDEGQVAQGIRTNPETGETYYTDPPAGAAATRVKSFAATDVPTANGVVVETPSMLIPAIGVTPAGAAVVGPATNTVAGRLLTQRQKTLDNQQKIANQGDWRVRLSLAEDSNYLYNAPSKEEQGILAPLNGTYGVIFPYTPKIDVSYKANYASESLTHSNYLSYFYRASSVDQVRISCPFTAQDTTEAAYLLAVIHFFRSATKMFYGQDAQRGAPPPLVFLTGLGQYQFNNHPCVITSFEYSLPADVDYIRAGSPNINGTDLLVRRTSEKNNLPTGIASSVQARLNALFTSQGINKGANKTVSQGTALVPSFSKNAPTYVPTKIDLAISMYPIVTRTQASRQFSLKQFANGELVKQGFW
jgi:hypothetical protein